MGEASLFKLRFRSANKHTRTLAFFAVATCIASILWVSANFTIQAVKTSWNEHRLSELVENVILRAEFAIDNVIIAEVDLLSAGHTTCNAETIAAVRTAIYQHSALVDIQLHDSLGTCQAFEDIGFDQADIMAAKAGALSARNSSFSFMPLADDNSLGLGVVWEFQQDHVMTAIIRTDGLLFDMLPAGIRDDASLALALDDGALIAQYRPTHISDMATGDAKMMNFLAASDRFPIAASLSIPTTVFHSWHNSGTPLLPFVTALMSAAFALLIARGFVRAPSERELLQAALRSGEIKPFFQPIINLSTTRVVGCEILARWIKSDGSHVSPNIFIPLAELTDQSDDITRALMRETGHQLASAIAGRSAFKININITAKQLAAPHFTEEFLAHAKDCGLPKQQMVVELIERDSMDGIESTKAALSKLQSHGIRVAIDDVGTGQNGLALLQSLGADIVKIDKLFVDFIDEDDSSRTISEMLVRIAKSSDMSLVAEGIEREAQAITLQAMGIQEAQGFYFARPMPAKDFLNFLEADADKSIIESGPQAHDATIESQDDSQKAA